MKKRFIIKLVGIILGCWALASYGQGARQTAEGIYQAADEFLREYVMTLPGEGSYEIGRIDSRLSIPACLQPRAELSRNAKPWGRTRIAVVCPSPSWTIYVPATIRVQVDYPVAARPLKPGDILTEADIRMETGDISAFPQNVEIEVQNLLGKRLSSGLSNGQYFRQNMLKTPLLVRRGQNVNIRYDSEAFSATNTGQALSDGGEGDLIGVRTAGGQVIRGIVHADGTVRVQ